jgi:regulator of replication initiation timing
MDNTLGNIESLVEHLTAKVETLLEERGEMLLEMSRLRAALAKRDEEAVKASQEMISELEAVRTKALLSEQEQFRIESKLRDLNDRLIALVRRGENRHPGS